MKKSTAILSILIIVATLLAMGCTGSNNSSGPTATSIPAATPMPTTSITSSSAALSNISAGLNTTNSTYIDPSIVDITNETDESVPDEG